MHSRTIQFAIILPYVFLAPAWGGTIYVDSSATGTGDGSSWVNAKTDLEAAVAGAASGDGVWVAQGFYAGTVALKNGVAIYGGFQGGETSASQADPFVNRTFIIGGGAVGRAVRSDGNDATAVLQGFQIVYGRVACPEYGAGMELCNSTARIIDCVFTNNEAEALGGALCTWGGGPTFENCIFHNNDGGWAAGAILNRDNGAPTFTNCLFYQNTAWEAGAIANMSGAATFTSCTFADNTATEGKGGAFFDTHGSAVLSNCVLWNNTADDPGTDGIYNNPSTGGTTTVTYSDVEGGWSGTGNIDADPKFAYPADGNYQLTGGSPCIDAGDNATVTGTLDLDGVTRKLDDPGTVDTGSGTAPIVDMGSYEYDGRSFFAGHIPKNRYISIAPDAPGTSVAIRVTLLSSALFPSVEGQSWWVQTPFTVVDGSETLSISRLACNPVFMDLSGVSILHLGDAEIVPDATYVVESVSLGDSLCTSGGDFSPPSRVQTVVSWGDVAQARLDPSDPWKLPDAFSTSHDADAVDDKLNSVPGAPPLVRCDLDPQIPNSAVDTVDKTRATDASGSPPAAYPFSAPVVCSSGCNYGKCCKFGTCTNKLSTSCNGTWTPGTLCEQEPDPCSGGGGCPPFCGE